MVSLSVYNVLLFHKLDRMIYHDLVVCGRRPEVARNIVAFFMLMELIGVDVIGYIRSTPDHNVVLLLAAEADVILNCIRQELPPRSEVGLAVPRIASLVSQPVDLEFFYRNRGTVIKQLVKILDGVGLVIFDEHLHVLFFEYEDRVRCRLTAMPPLLPRQLAEPYQRVLGEDFRSMFVMFSKGSTLTPRDIAEYFTRQWGDCIEKVLIEKRSSLDLKPVYGKVVFTGGSFLWLVFHGRPLVKFVIKGNQLNGKRFYVMESARYDSIPLVRTKSPLESVEIESLLELVGTENLLKLVGTKSPLELVGTESPLESVVTESRWN
ncbi:hypothetical protein BHM03_00055838 [Ensete ventricosum]|nr:hypothetical protein BHM03_00055838 [Ensete ventricosum]